MLRKYLKDIAFIQALNLLVKPVWILIIDREVQNQLSQQAYGEYFALYNFSLLFFIILDLGITNFNTTQLAKDPKRLKRLFGNLFGLKLLLGFLYLFLVFSIGSAMGYDSTSFELLILIAFVQILTSFNQYFRSSVNAFQLFKHDGFFMVLDRLIMIALVAYLIWGDSVKYALNIENFIYAQLIALGVVAVLLLTFIYFKLDRVKLSFKLKNVFPLLKKAWPYGLLVALMGLFNYVDGVMIQKLSLGRDADAGVYAMGYRLYFAVFMFAQIFSNVLLSMYSKHIGERSKLLRLSSFNARLLVLGAVGMAALSYIFRVEIIQWLYPLKSSREASEVFALLMVGFIGSAFMLVYGTLLTAKEKLRTLNTVAFITLIINLILNSWLIPEKGPEGAAVATMISQLAFGLSCFIIAARTLKFNYRWLPSFNN